MRFELNKNGKINWLFLTFPCLCFVSSTCVDTSCWHVSTFKTRGPPSPVTDLNDFAPSPQPIPRRRRWAAGRRRPDPRMSEPVEPTPAVGGAAAADGEATATDPELLCCLLQPSSADAGNADSDPSYVGVRRLLLHRKALAGAGSRKVVQGVVWIWFWVWWGIRFWIVVIVGLEV